MNIALISTTDSPTPQYARTVLGLPVFFEKRLLRFSTIALIVCPLAIEFGEDVPINQNITPVYYII